MPVKSGVLAAVEQVEAGTTRYVTPTNPLVINEVSPVFDDVVIQGGDIISTVQTNAQFKKLRKDS